MTVYNINLGIGWASSGVEYAQAYRYKLLSQMGIDSKYIFTDFISYATISELTSNIGFKDEDIIWLYSYFTDQTISPSRVTLEDVQSSIQEKFREVDRTATSVKFILSNKDAYMVAYFKKGNTSIVNRVEYVSKGVLIRKDYFAPQKLFTEYYLPIEGKVTVYQRRFFNADGSVAYDEIIRNDCSIFKFNNAVSYSKEELMLKLMESLKLTSRDLVLLDRSTGIGQAVFRKVKPAKLGVVVHAEHYNKNLTTDENILWNNFYEYQFTNADKVDFFITSTEEQKRILASQFQKYTSYCPNIFAIPVGSVSIKKNALSERMPYSAMTASRLAIEKHIDYLVRAVVRAKQVIPQLVFDIYGTGGEESKLRTIISQENASEYIRLRGHKDLSLIYKDYQVYLTASKSEGFGLTLLEATASGLPIIGFDVPYGNINFVQEGKNGYLIQVDDLMSETDIIQAIADRIIRLFKNSHLFDFYEYSYHIAAEYDDEHIKLKWQTLLKEMEND
ncbi:TPA: accessory Sec system glycosyltransferase GtfA [Streptococcus suis]|nr:accessory Sec system glycosyltransferase GtfA [Streptococcus suis]HEM3623146.1 accessory Sec system glycosyltransferase GtfA [Streptococcus suis]HEM3627379.1 accessory Sec system glycosyltransferase GtfA [Streptococcus suis]HEM3629935.1 accessory Sec system glycosyltransferase GtfA [Streptococcus suis]HEM3632011.1 accessory Sec system glycosyltransferase GtfA [Streptococcus suis]